MAKLSFPLKWRRSFDYVGLRGRTEPNHCVGSSTLYGTGADINPIDDWQRENIHQGTPPRLPRSSEKYAYSAWFKSGNMNIGADVSGFAKTAEEAKTICEAWLRQRC